MYRIVEQTPAQMQQGYFSSPDLYVDQYGKLTLVNKNHQTDLALNKPYTISGTLINPDDGKMFTDGIDGNFQFRFVQTLNGEIVVDLGIQQTIGAVKLSCGANAGVYTPNYLEILTSLDGNNFASRGEVGNGTNGQLTLTHIFEPVQARYVKFNLKRTVSNYIAIAEGYVYPSMVYSSYREIIYDISSLSKLRTNSAYWLEDSPMGTSVVVETSISLDAGTTWTDWSPLYNGGAIQNIPLGTDLSDARLKIRTTLTTNNINVPSLCNFNFYFDDSMQTDNNNIIIPKNAYSLNKITENMTSSNTPQPYVVSGTGVNVSTHPPWRMFDGILESSVNSERWYANPGHYVQIDIGEQNPRSVSKLRLHRFRTSLAYITGFRLEGSPDSLSWKQLYEANGLSWENSESFKEFDIDIVNTDTRVNYRFFRLVVTTKGGTSNAGGVALYELELFELVDGYGYQIPATLLIPHGENLRSTVFIPINNRATGSVTIRPVAFHEVPSKVFVKLHSNLSSRVNVPINNRATGIINIVERPVTLLSLPPEKDAFVRQRIPKLNYGTEQDMYAGFNTNYNEIYRSFVGFDVSAIPNDAEIKTAYFKFYNALNNSPVQKVEIYEVASDWTERGITWNNQPRATDKIAEIDVGSAGGYLYVDFTEIVREWYEGAKTNRGFIIKVSDETETYYKRFYTREGPYPPTLEIEYYDKTILTFDKVDIHSKVLVRKWMDQNIPSRLNVNQIWFDSEIPSRLRVAVMGVVDSNVIVRSPVFTSKVIIRRTESESLPSRLVVRIKTEESINSRAIISRKFQFGRVRVRRSDFREFYSRVAVREWRQLVFPSFVFVKREYINSRVRVVHSCRLSSRVRVIQFGNTQLKSSVVVRRNEMKDIPSHIRVFYKQLLPSRVHVISGYLKSRVYIPNVITVDYSSRVVVRAKDAKDLVSRIRIGDPYDDSWGYVYIL